MQPFLILGVIKIMIKLIAYLGNYGAEYNLTRHNVAWFFADSMPWAGKLYWQSKFKGQFASCTPAELAQWACDAGVAAKKDGSPVLVPEEAPDHIYFIKPETYMNLSGESIIEVANFYKIKAEEILVVHDELELAPGFYSFKWSGGLGGHNGLRSMKTCFGTADFFRMRFGIGRPNHNDIAGYVLSRFTEDEQIHLSQVFVAATQKLIKVLFSKKPEDFVGKWEI